MGRPSKFKLEYCQQLIDFMAKGYSYEIFATEIGVARQTMYDWEEVHEDWKNAKVEGFLLCQKYFETAGVNGMAGTIKNFNAAVWIFQMKNRFGWRDKQDVDVGGKEGSPGIKVIIEDFSSSAKSKKGKKK